MCENNAGGEGDDFSCLVPFGCVNICKCVLCLFEYFYVLFGYFDWNTADLRAN